jgi:hypothetical protein
MRDFYLKRLATVLAAALVCGAGTVAVAQSNNIHIDRLKKKGDIYYHPTTGAPYTGVADASPCQECGAVARYTLKDGKFHGEFTAYDEYGGVSGHYKDGKKHGEWTYNGEIGLHKMEYYNNDKLYEMWNSSEEGWKLLDGNGNPAMSNSTGYTSENGVLYNKDKTILVNCPSAIQGALIIPNSVTAIRDGAFPWYGAGLTSITIGSGIKDIKNLASIFGMGDGGGSALTSIEVAAGNAKYDSENGVLFNKNKTALIRYPAGKEDTLYSIPNGVTSIEKEAFKGCGNLKSVAIPQSAVSIGEGAFSGCDLASIVIPQSVTSIGKDAFSGIKTVIVLGAAPPKLGGTVGGNCLHVQQSSVDAYRRANHWKTFDCINAIMEVDTAPAQQTTSAQPAASARRAPKIAVYVFGADAPTLNKAMATQLITTLSNSGHYQAAENYKEIFNRTAETHKNGAASMDSNQAKNLGRQFGVDYVCVAEITTVSGEKRAAARIFNASTGEIAATGASDVPLKTLTDLATVSEQIVGIMQKNAPSRR